MKNCKELSVMFRMLANFKNYMYVTFILCGDIEVTTKPIIVIMLYLNFPYHNLPIEVRWRVAVAMAMSRLAVKAFVVFVFIFVILT